jgi:HNH endonuclease
MFVSLTVLATTTVTDLDGLSVAQLEDEIDSRDSARAPARARRARPRLPLPGCQNQRFVDAHHVEHWAHGGETTLDDLVLLCPRHHTLVHECGYTIDGDGNFYNRFGLRVPEVWQPPSGDVDELRRSHAAMGIGPRTCAGGDHDPMELDLAVDILLSVTGAALTHELMRQAPRPPLSAQSPVLSSATLRRWRRRDSRRQSQRLLLRCQVSGSCSTRSRRRRRCWRTR